MKQQYIEFKISHQQITRTDDFFVVGGSKGYLRARFSFCEDWADEPYKYAVFTANGLPYPMLIENGECEVPWEVLRSKRFYVGCAAGLLLTSNAAKIHVCPCGHDATDPNLEPTPTMFAALMKKLSGLEVASEEEIAAAVAEYMEEHSMDAKGAVKYSEVQILTDAEKAQARENIGALGKQVQADFAQNDPETTDYVKNRTHYEKTVSEYVVFEGEIDMGANATVSIDYAIPAGTVVEQYIDGSLLCTVTAFTSGDKVLASDGRVQVDFYNDSLTATVGNYYQTGTVKIVARDVVAELKQLAEKFIPDSIPRRTDIPAAPSGMTGASAGTAGAAGLAPAPTAGAQDHVLHGDGTWRAVDAYSKAYINAALGSYITDIDTLIGGEA